MKIPRIYNVAYTLFLTGLSGSGKSTIAEKFIEKWNNKYELPLLHLDGDVLRKGLCSDLGFSDNDRKENIRRVIELCNLLNKNNIFVISTFIAPFNETRLIAKEKIPKCKLIYINTTLKECINRDPKGLYEKAQNGEIKHFTGLDSPFEDPSSISDLIINTDNESVNKSVNNLFKKNKEWLKNEIENIRLYSNKVW